MTAPYHTEAPSSTITSPTSTAVGATNAVGCTCGRNSSNENSGNGTPSRRVSEIRARDLQRVPRRTPFGTQPGRLDQGQTLDEDTAVLAGRTGDAIGRVVRTRRPPRPGRQRQLDANACRQRRAAGHRICVGQGAGSDPRDMRESVGVLVLDVQRRAHVETV